MLKYFRSPENKKYLLFVNLYLPLFFAGLVGVYVKASLLNGYWLSIARLIDKNTVPVQVGLSYFSLDIIINLFLVPCFFVVVAFFFFKRIALVITTLISSLLIVFYFVQLRVQDEIGQYASSSLLYEAFLFVMNDTAMATGYVNGSAIIKLLLILLVTVLCSIILYIADKHESLTRLVRAGQGALVGVAVVSVAVALFFYPEKSSGLYQAAVHKIMLSTISEEFVSIYANSSLDKSLADYRELTKTPDDITNKAVIASEKGSNVLYFIMETGPADTLPDGVTELVPDELIQNSLIAEQHHTTYPYTSDSIFSLLSGFYPEGRRRLVENGGFKQHRGVFAQLSDEGYETGAYVPSMYNAEVDEKMLYQFGFNKIFVARRSAEKRIGFSLAEESVLGISQRVFFDDLPFEQRRLEYLREILFYDLYTLEKMKADILSTLRGGGKFAHIYLPQIGHGPWFKIGDISSQKEYGRLLMKLQSVWLRDIVLMLKNEGALKKTIIVLTSDHGVRTKSEDLSLQVGTISSYSFHIPLVVYSPSGFMAPVVTQEVTSHVDVESSISLLLGLQSDIGVTEGVPLWESAPDRQVYFFSNKYGGAEGFYDGQFFMNNIITGIQYKNTTMKFPTADLIILKQEEKDFVLNRLDDFRYLHGAIMFAL